MLEITLEWELKMEIYSDLDRGSFISPFIFWIRKDMFVACLKESYFYKYFTLICGLKIWEKFIRISKNVFWQVIDTIEPETLNCRPSQFVEYAWNQNQTK